MVYLIGAGPGDAGLITQKGAEILRTCEVLIYDRLGTNELLELVPVECKLIYVGKKPCEHSKKQEEINQILVEYGSHYETVVRLKGGDPFVFGRGGEEVYELEKHNIPYQLVPGITSAIAVPELAGIPVTHRAVSRGFHVYTAHVKEENAPLSYVRKEEGTYVFLMGVSKLPEIVNRLLEVGESETLPVSVISHGSLPGEKRVDGTLKDIVMKTQKEGITSPAVIVAGEVAKEHMKAEKFCSLSGKKIGVIGTTHVREKISHLAQKRGASVSSLCTMEVLPQPEIKYVESVLAELSQYRYIVFTSSNGVSLFFEEVKRLHFDFRRFSQVFFAVIGSGTAKKLREYGFEPDYIPKHYTTKALAQGLSKRLIPGERICIPRALQGSRELTEILKENGILCTDIPIYDVVGHRTLNWEYLYEYDVITFASSSGVTAFVEELMKEQAIPVFLEKKQKEHLRIAAIGEVTEKKLAEYGIVVDIVPERCEIESMVSEIEKNVAMT